MELDQNQVEEDESEDVEGEEEELEIETKEVDIDVGERFASELMASMEDEIEKISSSAEFEE